MSSQLNQMPPYNREAEVAVCGSLLIDSECMYDIVHILSKDDFFTDDCRLVFEACLEVYHRGEVTDEITVARQLSSMGKLQEMGGVSFLARIVAEVPTSAHAEWYARIVHSLAINRKVISMSANMSNLAFQGMDSEKLVEEIEKGALEIRSAVSMPKLIKPEEWAKQGVEYYKELQKGQRQGIYTGIYELDQLTGGLFGGEFCILAARPGFGKTDVMLSMAEYVGQKFGNVMVASLEQHWRDILDRIQSRNLNVSTRKIRTGNYSSDMMEQIINTLALVSESNIYLYDSGQSLEGTTVDSIFAIANHMKLAYGLRALFIDYLGLIREGEDKYSAYERTTLTSKKLKNMCRMLDIPVICLCQLNREIEHRLGHIPQLSDLRDSGSLEQDADSVWFIYRPEKYEDERNKAHENNEDITGVAYIIVGKQRQEGGVADSKVKLLWDRQKRQYFGARRGDLIAETPAEFR